MQVRVERRLGWGFRQVPTAALSVYSWRSCIEQKIGRKIAVLRAQMARLVDEGLVVPTAPPTDTSRRYILKA